ncbi:hypothetical protein H5410_055376 [Solanum commersonii]|uniref:Uncharacterized protein n=1 Tax=Solanum commersonii TaxID=4109 RepID=A0A9J5WI32_SOLCO|nr:hypothetical protein H5410_055376 [Solanum commersonii]
MTTMNMWWKDRHVDEILGSMSKRHIDYPTHYDPIDVILDLNFYNFLKTTYDELCKASSEKGVIPLKDCLDTYKDSPRNDSGAVCGSYSLSYIEYMVTRTPMTLMNDNTVSRMQWRWAVGSFGLDTCSPTRLDSGIGLSSSLDELTSNSSYAGLLA